MAYHDKPVSDRVDIMVATPILDPVVSTYHVDGLLEMYSHPPPKVRFARRHAFGRDIVRARSRLARQFIESQCTHLLYVDGDNVPNSEALKGMLKANKEVVGCPYPRREIHPPLRPNDLSSCLRYSYLPSPGAKVDNKQCLEIFGIGFGFILIQRRVIERLIERCQWHASPEAMAALDASDMPEEAKNELRIILRNTFIDDVQGNDNKVTTALFSLYQTEDHKMLGEDYSFCARCRDEGIKVHMYLGPGSPIEHDGTCRYGQRGDKIGVVHDGGDSPLPIADEGSDDP